MKNTLSIIALLLFTVSCVKKSTSSAANSTSDSFTSTEKTYNGFVQCFFLDSLASLESSATPRLKAECAPQNDEWNITEGYVGNLLSTSSTHWTRGLSYSISLSLQLGGDKRIGNVNTQLDNLSLLEIMQALNIENRLLSSTKPILDKIHAAFIVKESGSDLANSYDSYWESFTYRIDGFTKAAPVTLARYSSGNDLLAEIGNFTERPVSSFDPTSAAPITESVPETIADDTGFDPLTFEPLGPTQEFEPLGPTQEFEPLGPTQEFEPLGPTQEFEPSGPTLEGAINNSSSTGVRNVCLCGEHLEVYMMWNETTRVMGAWRYTKTNKVDIAEICDSLLAGGTNIKTNKILEAYHQEVLGQAAVCDDYLLF